ncbi:hypothetical protein A6X21_21240 [Planctopirus hydrillae]|uniref:Uncharacterized protein n=1 Tax=Planctopirus hydrillae TaxID=1841610 RepID=A0A1C3EFL2_9PLAN|nr:hypothetical protein A6X21_21240 [Planctopirus hydrillae]
MIVQLFPLDSAVSIKLQSQGLLLLKSDFRKIGTAGLCSIHYLYIKNHTYLIIRNKSFYHEGQEEHEGEWRKMQQDEVVYVSLTVENEAGPTRGIHNAC